MNLFSILEDAAERWPEDVAVVHDGRSFRYAELHRAAESLALRLREAGVRVGNKVGVMCPNSAEYIAAFFAVLRVGGITTPIPPAWRAAEILDLTEAMGLSAVCCSPHFVSLVPKGKEHGRSEAVLFDGKPPLWITPAEDRVMSAIEREPLLRMTPPTISFTSGTTATAKGIIVSSTAFSERVKTYCRFLPLTRGDGILWLQPMTGTLMAFMCGCLSMGVTIVLSDVMDTPGIPTLLRRHHVVQIQATPLFYRILLNERDIVGDDLRCIKYFVSNGTFLPIATSEAFRNRFGREIVQTYGLVESGPVLVNLSEDVSKRGSVGRLLEGWEIKLEPPRDEGAGGDDIGELLLRGPGLFDGYYRPWRLRDEVLENGWFRTGDLARRDADGYYWIVGRVKDVINVAGVKVFPSEIEEVLLAHAAVDEAAVFGSAEPKFGEAPHARVKLVRGASCTEKELLHYVNQRLSVFKALRSIEFVGDMPKTTTGKIRRFTS